LRAVRLLAQPPVHVRAVLDLQLYALMNWSMVLDGVLFWCLVLDVVEAIDGKWTTVVHNASESAVLVAAVLMCETKLCES
jgi:hypothetical protein